LAHRPAGRSDRGIDRRPAPENGDLLMTAAKDILIIEDDEILRDLVADWMAAAGYGVRVAADGDAGLAAIDDHPPALVVTDIHMPGAGGAAVIAELRRAHPAVPVIAISAYFKCGHGLTADGAIALGAARALAKPFSRREMVGAVAALVGPPGA
jgi:CheY-like chemotaxis protein